MTSIFVRRGRAIELLGEGGNRYFLEKLVDCGRIGTKAFPGAKQKMYRASDVEKVKKESQSNE